MRPKGVEECRSCSRFAYKIRSQCLFRIVEVIMNSRTFGFASALVLACSSAIAAGDIKPDQSCVPGVSFWSLLGSVGIGYTDGRLQVQKLYATCLPVPKTPSDSNYAYSPEQGGKLASVIRSADGQALATYVWRGENISGLWELSDYKVLGGLETVKPLAAGSYALEFQIEGAPFYRFPFAVSTLPGDDPYEAAGTRWFLDAPWSDYGNIFYQRNDPQSTLRFTTWVRDKAGHAQQRSVPYSAQLVRAGDGKTIGEEKGTLRLDPKWGQLDVYFQPAGGGSSERLKAADVLAQDSAYRVDVSIDGKKYGSYTFVVSGGKIQLQGFQTDKTPPSNRIVDYLYGGKYRSWWIRRDGADAKVAR